MDDTAEGVGGGACSDNCDFLEDRKGELGVAGAKDIEVAFQK